MNIRKWSSVLFLLALLILVGSRVTYGAQTGTKSEITFSEGTSAIESTSEEGMSSTEQMGKKISDKSGNSTPISSDLEKASEWVKNFPNTVAKVFPKTGEERERASVIIGVSLIIGIFTWYYYQKRKAIEKEGREK